MNYYDRVVKRIEEATEYENETLNCIQMIKSNNGIEARFYFNDDPTLQTKSTEIRMKGIQRGLLEVKFKRKVEELLDIQDEKILERL